VLVIAQGLYALLFLSGGRRRVAVGALALIGLLFVPGCWWSSAGRRPTSAPASPVHPHWRRSTTGGSTGLREQWALLLGLALLGLVTLVYGERVRVRWRPFGPAFLLLAWFVVPIALTYLLNFTRADPDGLPPDADHAGGGPADRLRPGQSARRGADVSGSA
jgi:hypothetical protein